MHIMYAHVWMRLIQTESKFAGFAFNALLNSHLCGQVFTLIPSFGSFQYVGYY